MRTISIVMVLCASAAAYGQEVRESNVTIDPYLYFQHYEHFKRLTLSSPDSQIESIEGFEFDWGYTCELAVQETNLSTPISDGTSSFYTLKKVISKTKIPDTTRFSLFLDAYRYYHQAEPGAGEAGNAFKQINDSIFLYFDEVEIEVPKPLSAAFDLILNGTQKKAGTFVFIDAKTIRLVEL